MRLPGSSTNCPKWYKLLIENWLSYMLSEFFTFFQRSLKDFQKPKLENMPVGNLDSCCAFSHEMSHVQEQMSNGSAKRIRVAARPIRSSELESFVAVTEPELNSQTSSKSPNELCAIFRQLAKYRQLKLSQVTKNHLLRIGPPTASYGSAWYFKWSSFGCSRFRGKLTEEYFSL